MLKNCLMGLITPIFLLASCQHLSDITPTLTVVVFDYPPLDWSVNAERIKETGCVGVLQESCSELIALGCDEISPPRFYTGGLMPSYAIGECIHQGNNPPNPAYFKKPAGLDSRYRSYIVFYEDDYRLVIKRTEFREIFVPVESADEALSYAMAMTSLTADFNIAPNANREYLAGVIEETHVEETPAGYVVHLFDSDHRMGCDTHEFFAVRVLVTQSGEVSELSREKIYTSYACFDFDGLTLDQE